MRNCVDSTNSCELGLSDTGNSLYVDTPPQLWPAFGTSETLFSCLTYINSKPI
jgi:hypothetical protein